MREAAAAGAGAAAASAETPAGEAAAAAREAAARAGAGASDKNDKKFDDKVNNFLRFAMDNFDTELVVMGIKLALTQYQLPIDPDEVDCFDEFHERFGKYIKAAQGEASA